MTATWARTKSIDDVLEQGRVEPGGEAEPGRLKRTLGPLGLMGFGIGVVIGTGIFTLTGVEAKESAGPAVTLSFLLAGVAAALAALCYAELSSGVPAAGSAYTYAYATIGELAAWIIGWDLLLEFALGAATVARGWSSYLQDLFNLPTSLFGEKAPVNVGALALVLVLGVVAVVGVKQSSRVTGVLVAVKVAICVFVVVAGLFYVKGANLHPYVPAARASEAKTGISQPLVQAVFGLDPTAFGIAGVLSAAAVVFFAYTGFEAVANLGEETRDPGRDLPLGLLGTLGIATVLYIGVSFVVTGMVDYRQLDVGAPIAKAFDAVGAGWASTLVSIAAVAGLTSVTLVDLVTMPRIFFAMGRDRLLPPRFAELHPRYGTPVLATVITTAMVAVLATFVKLTVLADLVSIGTLFAFVVVAIAVPVLRHTRPQLERPFRVPLSPFVPVLSALFCVYLMMNLSVETWLRFLVWLLLGLVVYVTYGRRNAKLAAAS
ncbi:MAG: amino acid permease-associated protein [Frankiales bacterium]|nr:amino acid permease-associated protein [Frankiales bacterium]